MPTFAHVAAIILSLENGLPGAGLILIIALATLVVLGLLGWIGLRLSYLRNFLRPEWVFIELTSSRAHQ
jgi:hypothetical protein